MPAHDLHGAVSPAIPLFLVIAKIVRHEAATVTPLDIDGLVSIFKNSQSELGVLSDAPLTPPTCRFQRGAPNQCHGAMLNDGITRIPGYHANVEKAAIFRITHRLE